MTFNYLKTFILILFILAGCAKVPDKDLAQLSSPIPLDQSSEAALAREFFEQGGWPTTRWWEMFEDPQLNEIIELALRESPTLNRALAKVAEIESIAKSEGAALFPLVDLEYL